MTLGGEDMLRKMIKVKNRVRLIKGSDYFNNKADEDESILPSSMTIGENNIYSEEAGIYKVLLEGNFGNNISKLTNFIVQPTR